MSDGRKLVGGVMGWIAALMVFAGFAGAQPMLPGAPINPENFDAKESSQGVYAPESTVAMDQLALAQKMERLKEWNKSADLYQEVLSNPQYANKVIPSHQDETHHIDQYTSVCEMVMQRLSKWPPEGLEVYRARYETPAAALLDSAKDDDPQILQQVFSQYFVTNAGLAAGIRLMDQAMEAGEFRAAASHGERLLRWHPNLVVDRAGVLYRTALAYHLVGDDAAAQARLDELKRRDPQAKGVVRGRDVVLADSLADELKSAAPQSVAAGADSYTTFGGDPTRNRVPAVSATPGAHLYSIVLSKPTHDNLNAQQTPGLDELYKNDAKDGSTIGVMPVVDRGELFFQDGKRVYAVNLESGVPLPGWQQSHGVDNDGAYTLAGVVGYPRLHQLTLTVTDHAVLAVMGQPDAHLARFGISVSNEVKLVCLDRVTGKENWIVAPSQFAQASLKSLQFTGCPLVVGDSVLVSGVASKQAGLEECYVLCLDLNSGTLRWSSLVASANINWAVFGAGFNPNIVAPQNEVHLAYANGQAIVQTNRGAIAALDVYTGTIAWLDIHPRPTQTVMNPARNPMFFQPQYPVERTKPWAFNPPMISQGMIFALPTESQYLLIYDAATGQEYKRIDLTDLTKKVKRDTAVTQDYLDTLVGINGDMLVLAGSQAVAAINWKLYDTKHYDDNTMLFWDGAYAKPFCGRSFLTTTRLVLPMQDHLYSLGLHDGLVAEEYPAHPRSWEDDEEEKPGNVLVTSDHIVIATATQVDVYTDMQAARKKLDRELAAAPKDPQARLRYAEVMYAAGDYPTSLTKLDEAIDLLGGPKSMQAGLARDRVFSDAMSFAQKLRAEPSKSSRARVEQLFERAREAAATPEQQVQYRLSRGRFEELRNEPPTALTLYQEILSEPTMRTVALSDDTTNAPASADVIARRRIAEMVRKDPQIYAGVEKLAVAALDKASESNDPAVLLEVARVYPNSSVAGKATLAAADAYEARGDLLAARHVLNDVYFDHNEQSPEWPLILEAMARTNPAAAAHMLAQGVEQLHDPKLAKPLKLPDGTEIADGTNFSAALERMRKTGGQWPQRTLANFNLPIPKNRSDLPEPFLAKGPVISNVDVLVLPVRSFIRPDRIVTWSRGPLLSLFAVGSDKALATTDQFAEEPKGCAWVADGLVIWSEKTLALLKADDATVIWKRDLGALPPLEVLLAEAADNAVPPQGIPPMRLNRFQRAVVVGGRLVRPAAAPGPQPAKPVAGGPERIEQVLPAEDRILVAMSSGRVLALDAKAGHTVWQTRLTDRSVDRLLADADFTVIFSQDDTSYRLAVVGTFTGHVRGTSTFTRESNSYPQNIALSPDGTLVYTLPDRLCLRDLYKRWDQKPLEKLSTAGQGSFSGLSGPDQLVVSEGRVLALTDTSITDHAGEKFIRVYSLETGEPMMISFGDGQQVEKALSIGSKSNDVSLHVVGPRVYAIAPDAAVCYNLDRPDDHYQMFDPMSEAMTAHQAFVGKDYVILLDGGAPVTASATAITPGYSIYAFSRLVKNNNETGRLDYNAPVADPAGITPVWQPLDGGLAYLAADHRVHQLLGAGGK